MAKKNNGKVHSIYLLDNVKVREKFNIGECETSDEIINKIMDKQVKYTEQDLLENIDTKGFKIRLFYCGKDKDYSALATFCRDFVKQGQKIFTAYPKEISSILFISSQKHIFAVTTGQGFRIIDDISLYNFGILLINTFSSSFKVTATDGNPLSGLVHNYKTIYADEIDIIDIGVLDTVYKEVAGRLKDKEIVRQYLQLDEKSKKNSLKVIAKSQIQFSSSLDFQGLLHLLSLIDEHDYNKLKDVFNFIQPIKGKHNAKQIEKNNEAVVKNLFNTIKEEQKEAFDIFNKDTNAFISAESYAIYCENSKIAETQDVNDYTLIREAYRAYLKDKKPSLENFKDFMSKAKLVAEKGDVAITEGSILNHISGEIEVGEKNYYVLYGQYYCLKESYSDRLNEALSKKLTADKFVQVIESKWEKGKDEDQFNDIVASKEEFIYLHKITPENVEFADLLKIENGKAIIVHVKEKFDNNMRALDRQVEMSITRLLDLRNNNNDTYMKELYKKAVESKIERNMTKYFPTQDEFISCMKSAQIQYVIAMKNKDLLKSKSNIAKHCLNSLIVRCLTQGIDLKINFISEYSDYEDNDKKAD